MKAVFISTDNLKKRPTFVQANVEDSVLGATIYRVQDVMISPILGRKLYVRLVNAVLAGSGPTGLNVNEKILIEDYVIDCMMAGCEMRGVIHTTDQIRNKATGEANDEFLKPIDDDRSKMVRDTFRRDFDHYREILICYLRENYKLFPEYYSEGMPGFDCCRADRPDSGTAFRNIHFP